MIPFIEIVAFVRESNRIEGISRNPTTSEIEATEQFIVLSRPNIRDIRYLVSIYQPGAVLRDEPHLNVRVGNHIAPIGGPAIADALQDILDSLAESTDPWTTHCAYETLHPFTDGNGRSGRTVWLWQMNHLYGRAPLGFLHHFYYQTLSANRANS